MVVMILVVKSILRIRWFLASLKTRLFSSSESLGPFGSFNLAERANPPSPEKAPLPPGPSAAPPPSVTSPAITFKLFGSLDGKVRSSSRIT